MNRAIKFLSTAALPTMFVAMAASPALAEPVTCDQDLRDVRLIDFNSGADGEAPRNIFTCGSGAKTSIDEGFGLVGQLPLSGFNGMAIGIRAEANGVSTMALGLGARAQRIGGLAIGELAFTGGPRTTSVGQFAQSLGENDAAFGASATVRGDNGSAFGAGAQADLGGSAFGAGARALLDNSVALGRGSVADRANAVSFGTVGGERQLINIAAGTQASDAVNKAQLDVVAVAAATAQGTADLARTEAAAALLAAQDGNQASSALAMAAQATADTALTNAATAQGTAETARTEAAAAQTTANTALVRVDSLGASTASALGGGSNFNAATGSVSAPSYMIGGQSYASVGSALDAVDDRLGLIDTRVDALSASSDRRFRHANGGIAAAMAMGGTMIVPDSTVSMNFNLATFRGEQGFSGAVVVRAAPRVYVSGGFAGSTVKGSTGGRVGVAFGF